MKNSLWFKDNIASHLKEYEIRYRFLKNGDFGSLDQVEFNSERQGGEIDFWSTGWMSIHLVDYITRKELINALLEPHQIEEQERVLQNLIELLTIR